MPQYFEGKVLPSVAEIHRTVVPPAAGGCKVYLRERSTVPWP